MTMLEWALKYAAQGFAVFPLAPRSKTPATAHGFQDASTDPEQIRKWWERQPRCNIGVATGHGLVVIDVDDKEDEGKNGSDALRKWEAEHGDFIPTWTVLTGTGGRHFWYKTQDNFKNTVEILGAIDVRSLGGYVVAPPSIHPNGLSYEWEASGDPDDVDIAELSGSALELLQTYGSNAYERKQRTAEYKEQETIPKGQRQSSLMSLQGSLLNLNLSVEAIKAAVREENDLKCDPPFTDAELEKEIFPFLYRDIVPTGDYTDTVAPAFSLDEDDGLPAIVSLRSVWDTMPPLRPELIEGILRQGHKMIIASTSKAGKTFMLMELAMKIAEGHNWIGHRCKQGKVLYINMELDSISFFHRFRDIYKKFGMTFDNHIENIEMWNLRGKGKPLTKLAPAIIKRMKDQNYLAVMIDPLYKVMDGDENSNGDVARMVASFDQIAEETGASVIYAHHFAKGSAAGKSVIDRAAGAGTFARDPDAILTMTQIDWFPQIEAERYWTAWRIESTLREFRSIEPVDVFFDWPIHKIDTEGRLKDCKLMSKENNQRSELEKYKQKSEIEALIEECKTYTLDEYTCVSFSELKALSNKPASTLRDLLKEAGYISLKPQGHTGIWGKIDVRHDDGGETL